MQGLKDAGTITLTGKIEMQAPVPACVTTDAAEAIEGVDVILVVTTADGHEDVARAIAGSIQPNQTVVLNPGMFCGSLAFKTALKRYGCPHDILVAEMADLMFACRKVETGTVFHSGLKKKAVLAAVQERENGLEGARQAMEEEGARQTSLLWGRLQYLMVVASIAPMVGLLGTVWGMMVSFLALDTQLAMANKVSNLTSGVSQAMFTTFGGLVIAIFSLAAYALFRGRLNRLAAQVEGECKSVLRRFRKA